MPQPTERSIGMVQINNWLGKCSRWLLLCIVVLLTVVLITAGSEADVTIII
jgi:TRAP-type mannitol/chloroaromatic compound transport system permease small subunit